MIRLDIRPTCGNYSNNHLKCLLRLEPVLRDLGVEYVTHNADIQLIQCVPDIERLVDRNIPTILQDLYLGPEIFWHGLRELMTRDNVKVVLKTSKFTDAALYDIRFQDDMKHVSVLTTIDQIGTYHTSISHLYNKIHVFAGLIAWDYFQQTWDNVKAKWPIPDFDTSRRFDISMMLGDIDKNAYPVEAVRSHRWESIYALKKLALSHPQLRILLRTPQDSKINRLEYETILYDSKTCFSPWGFDITCWRDYECALCGVLIIRPEMPWAITWPELPLTFCKPDLSDLETVMLKSIEDFPNSKNIRYLAYNQAKMGVDNKALAKRLLAIIKLALGS